MLALHLLQISLVYMNTLMVQNVLKDDAWLKRLTKEDYRGLTPLFYSHIEPYGMLRLDMETAACFWLEHILRKGKNNDDTTGHHQRKRRKNWQSCSELSGLTIPYLKSVFRALREELEIAVPRKEERLPEVPTEDEMRPLLSSRLELPKLRGYGADQNLVLHRCPGQRAGRYSS